MNQQQFSFIKNTVKTNDLSILKDLINLKNLYSSQLTKMPREYFVWLLFDTVHESLIMKIDGKIVAGVTFRGFREKSFYEIPFLAVSSQNRSKGLGSKIMGRFKNHCQQKEITSIFTFADDRAIGFFQKNGFSKQISLPQESYKAYLKEYSGGQLMECKINLQLKTDFETLRDDIFKIQDHLVYRQLKSLLPLAPYDIKSAIKIVKRKENEHKTSGELCEIIPGLKESGYIRDTEKENQKKPTLDFILNCQKFIELAFDRCSVLKEGFKETSNQDSYQSQQSRRGERILNDYQFLLYKLERKLKFGHFKYKSEILEEFSSQLKKILSLDNNQLKPKQKEFLTKINNLKFQFTKNLLPQEKLKSAKKETSKS